MNDPTSTELRHNGPRAVAGKPPPQLNGSLENGVVENYLEELRKREEMLKAQLIVDSGSEKSNGAAAAAIGAGGSALFTRYQNGQRAGSENDRKLNLVLGSLRRACVGRVDGGMVSSLLSYEAVESLSLAQIEDNLRAVEDSLLTGGREEDLAVEVELLRAQLAERDGEIETLSSRLADALSDVDIQTARLKTELQSTKSDHESALSKINLHEAGLRSIAEELGTTWVLGETQQLLGAVRNLTRSSTTDSEKIVFSPVGAEPSTETQQQLEAARVTIEELRKELRVVTEFHDAGASERELRVRSEVRREAFAEMSELRALVNDLQAQLRENTMQLAEVLGASMSLEDFGTDTEEVSARLEQDERRDSDPAPLASVAASQVPLQLPPPPPPLESVSMQPSWMTESGSMSARNSLNRLVSAADAQRAIVTLELAKLREEMAVQQGNAARHAQESANSQNTMRQKLEELRELLSDKSERLSESEEERDRALKDLRTQQAEVKELRRKISDVSYLSPPQMDSGRLKEIEEEYQLQLREAGAALIDAERRVQLREAETRELHAVLSELNQQRAPPQEVESLRDLVSQLQGKVADLSIELQNAESDVSTCREALAKAETEYALKYESRFESAQADARRQVAEVQDALRIASAEIRELEEERQTAVARSSAVESDRAQLLSLLGRKGEEFNILRGQLSDLEMSLQEKSTEVWSLTEVLTTTSNEVSLLTRSLSDARQQNFAVKEQVNDAEMQCDKLRVELSQARSQGASMQAKFSDLVSQLEAAQLSHAEVSAEVDACKEQISELESALVLSHGEGEATAQALREASEELREAQRLRQQLEREIGSARETATKSAADFLRREEELEAKVIEAEKLIVAARQELAVANASRAKMEEEAVSLRESMVAQSSAAANLQHRVGRLARRNATAADKIKALKEEMREGLQSLEQRLMQRENELALLRARVADRDSRYSALEDAAARGEFERPTDEMPSLSLSALSHNSAAGVMGAAEIQSLDFSEIASFQQRNLHGSAPSVEVARALSLGKKCKKKELIVAVGLAEDARLVLERQLFAAMQATARADDRAKRLSDGVADQVRAVQASETRVKTLATLLEESAEERRDLRRNVAEAAQQAEKMRITSEEQLRRVRKQCVSLRKSEKTLTEQLTSLKSELADAKSEVSRVSKEASVREDELMGQLSTMRTECERISKDLALGASAMALAVSSQSEHIKTESADDNSSLLASLKQRIADIENSLREERSASLRKTEQIADLQRRVTSQTQLLEMREATVVQLTGELHAAQKESVDNSSVASDDASIRSSFSFTSAASAILPLRSPPIGASSEELRSAIADRDARLASVEGKLRRLAAASNRGGGGGVSGVIGAIPSSHIELVSTLRERGMQIEQLQAQVVSLKMAKTDLEARLGDLKLVLMSTQSTFGKAPDANGSASSAASTQLAMAVRAVERLTAAAATAEARSLLDSSDAGSSTLEEQSRLQMRDANKQLAEREVRIEQLQQSLKALKLKLDSKESESMSLQRRSAQLEELLRVREQLASASTASSVSSQPHRASAGPLPPTNESLLALAELKEARETIRELETENSSLQASVMDMTMKIKVLDVRARKAAVNSGYGQSSEDDIFDDSTATNSVASSHHAKGSCRRCDDLSRRLGVANAELARATARAEAADAGLSSNFDDSSSNFGDTSDRLLFKQQSQAKDIELAKSHIAKLNADLDSSRALLLSLEEKNQQLRQQLGVKDEQLVSMDAQLSRLLNARTSTNKSLRQTVTHDVGTWTGPAETHTAIVGISSRLKDAEKEEERLQAALSDAKLEIHRLTRQVETMRHTSGGGAPTFAAMDELRERVAALQGESKSKEEQIISLRKNNDLLRRNMQSYKEEMSQKVNALREALMAREEAAAGGDGQDGDHAGSQLRLLLQAVTEAEAIAERERVKSMNIESARDVLISKVQALESELKAMQGGESEHLRQHIQNLQEQGVVRSRRAINRRLLGLSFSLWVQENEVGKMNRILQGVEERGGSNPVFRTGAEERRGRSASQTDSRPTSVAGNNASVNNNTSITASIDSLLGSSAAAAPPVRAANFPSGGGVPSFAGTTWTM